MLSSAKTSKFSSDWLYTRSHALRQSLPYVTVPRTGQWNTKLFLTSYTNGAQSFGTYHNAITLFLQLLGFRKHYFKDSWNQLDLFIVILSAVDIVLDIVAAGSMGGFSPGVLKVAKIFRVLRMGRVLKLFKVPNTIFLTLSTALLSRTCCKI